MQDRTHSGCTIGGKFTVTQSVVVQGLPWNNGGLRRILSPQTGRI
jgi:hypothetical protein